MNQSLPLNNPQFWQQFNSFAQTFKRNFGNVNPQQIVQNLLNNGQITQSQFNQCRNIVNQLTGMRL